MSNKYHAEIEAFMDRVRAKNGHEPEFLQAVQEVAEAVIPIVEATPKYKAAKILDRIVEPERTIIFRVPWIDDKGEVQDMTDNSLPGLYAAGELVGGLFYENYPGGSGLMSGTVFGKLAGKSAAGYASKLN